VDGLTCSTNGAPNCTVTGLTNGLSYTFTVVAANVIGTGPSSVPSGPVTPVVSATYVPLTPTRLLDTRYGTGLSGAFSVHSARELAVAGHGGVPSNAIAVTGNLTVTAQTSGGYLFAGPIPTDNPTSSTLNFPAGDDRANAVAVQLGADGGLWITFVAPTYGQSAAVIFDVTGYFVK
jgi:hypothetical protein